jgi:alpha-D-ribose 1-methylphosphonate 5-triphosphate synthase subunit PhnL
MTTMQPVLKVSRLTKSFVVHAQGDLALPVLRDVCLAVSPGECLALVGPSGAGKSTLLRSLYGNYRADTGSIRVLHDGAWTELVEAEPRTVLDVRRRTMGFVSQFLRVIPRVATVDVVAEPLLRLGAGAAEARDRAQFLLALLNIPQRLWALPPATFSGGEQQRVNIARSLIADYPILLLDEPTASLDPSAAQIVRARIRELAHEGNRGILWTSHNMLEVEEVCDRVLFLSHGKILLEGDPKRLPHEHGAATLEELFIRIAREPLASAAAVAQ